MKITDVRVDVYRSGYSAGTRCVHMPTGLTEIEEGGGPRARSRALKKLAMRVDPDAPVEYDAWEMMDDPPRLDGQI